MVRQGDLRPFLAFLALLSALSWAFVFWTAFHMDAPLVRLMMPFTSAWSPAEAIVVWLMWMVMMVAMMLPTAAPMITQHRRIALRQGGRGESLVFTLAYLLVLAATSLAATGLQWGLQGAGLLSPMLWLSSERPAALVLILAGIVQWTPLKHRCLTVCRTPAGFLVTHWQRGKAGALRMGLRHGLACLGCCWALMALLFSFGVMNLWAIVLLATVVAAEKLLPRGEVIARLGGAVFTLWGLWLILT